MLYENNLIKPTKCITFISWNITVSNFLSHPASAVCPWTLSSGLQYLSVIGSNFSKAVLMFLFYYAVIHYSELKPFFVFVVESFVFRQSEPQRWVPLSNWCSKYSHLSSWMFPGDGWAGHPTPAHSWLEGSSSCCWRCCISPHLPAAHQSALSPETRRSSLLLTAGPEQKHGSINVQIISS